MLTIAFLSLACPDGFNHFKPVHLRHVYIEQKKVEVLFIEPSTPAAHRGRSAQHAHTRQQMLHDLLIELVIFSEQHFERWNSIARRIPRDRGRLRL